MVLFEVRSAEVVEPTAMSNEEVQPVHQSVGLGSRWSVNPNLVRSLVAQQS